MLKKINRILLIFGLLFLLFEFVTDFSFFYMVDNLFQPHNLKGALKVGVYSFSYIFILINLLLLLLLKKGKLFYLLLTFISLTFILDSSYYFNGLNRGFSIDQFVLAINEKDHALEAISTFYNGTIKSLILFAVFMGIIWLSRKMFSNRFFYIPLLLLPISYVSGNLIQVRTVYQVYNYPSYVKVPLSIFNAYDTGLMDIPYSKRDEVESAPTKSSHYKNIILIVDESVRGDYLSINGYEKNTTSYLSSLDNLLTMGSIPSVANASASTQYILRNGVTIDELPDRNYKTLKKQTIFQYAKKAGFNTLYLDAQTYYKKLQNYMSSYDMEHIDHYITLRNKDNLAFSDRRMVKKLSKELKNSSGSNFVYFIKHGSHFKWQLSYPKSNEVFKPTLSIYEGLDFDNREKAVNTYLNSIKWGVDDFFNFLLNEIDTKDTLIIYTSDHGQNIIENNILITHGLAINPPSTMANVPLLIYANDIGYIKSKFDNIKLNSYSQYQIFPTLLDIMGYEDKIIEQYGLPFWKASDDKLQFFSGQIFGNGNMNLYQMTID